jgi:uncharacterized membrane protein
MRSPDPHLFASKNLYDLDFFHILNMKTKKTQNPSIFLATHWNLSLKSGDLDKFFHEKNLCIVLNHIFQVEVWRSFAKKRKEKKRKEKKHWRRLVPDSSLVLFLAHNNCFYLI